MNNRPRRPCPLRGVEYAHGGVGVYEKGRAVLYRHVLRHRERARHRIHRHVLQVGPLGGIGDDESDFRPDGTAERRRHPRHQPPLAGGRDDNPAPLLPHGHGIRRRRTRLVPSAIVGRVHGGGDDLYQHLTGLKRRCWDGLDLDCSVGDGAAIPGRGHDEAFHFEWDDCCCSIVGRHSLA